MGRIVLASNNVSLVTRRYDSLSDVLQETEQVLPSGIAQNIACTYDAARNRIYVVYPGGRIVSNSFDTLERLSAVNDSGGLLASFGYTGANREEQRDYRSGTRAIIALLFTIRAD